MPKFSNYSQIIDTKMKVIYAVKKKLQVNWAYLIMHHMVSQNKISGGLPYARLITKILQTYGIDLCGETRFQMTPKEHEINVRVANKNMRIFKDKDGIYRHREVGYSSSYVPMPEGCPTNQMIYEKLGHM